MTTTDEPRTFAEDGLIQVHWQKIDDASKTEMVAQGGEFKTAEEMHEWIREVVERRKSECPEGWQLMVCDSTSEYFVWAAPSA
jgi:hypothetical protein